MALYSHKHKLLFYHIYKTGGMSVRKAMHSIDDYCVPLIKGHADVKDIEGYFRENKLSELYENITKFSVVRDPYTWLYSIFQFARSVESHPFHQYAITHIFEEFILWYIEYTPFFNANAAFNGKIQTQSDYICINNVPQVQYILKYESLEEDFYRMMDNLNIHFPHPFPKENQTDYEKPPLIFFTCMDRSVINAFNTYFHNDFVNFNYTKL